MKTRETTPGKTYSVHTMKGCTIIEPDGWSKTIEAPDGYFDAHFGSVVIEGDDEASIKELFKLAPQQRLALLGVLGGGVPVWFKALETELTAMLDGSAFELAWLASKKQLIVHTDRVSDDMLAAVKTAAEAAVPAGVEVVQYNHNMEISWMDIPPGVPFARINKYDACVTQDDLAAINTKWNADTYTVTGAKDWFAERYPECAANLTSNNLYLYTFSNLTETNFADAGSLNITWLWCPELTTLKGSWLGQTSSQFTYFYAPKLTKLYINGIAGFDGYFPLVKTVQYQSHKNGTNGETECYAEFPSLEKGVFSTEWTQTRFSKKSVLRILGSIPSYASGTHTLTIGIHIDHQQDEEVLAAIANAESKGWTLKVQWNGTPTAQASVTYGLRRPTIYAKVGEMERPDGTTERYLDWGHYVTDTTGYEEFRSVEAAREYYGLPEEDLTETE